MPEQTSRYVSSVPVIEHRRFPATAPSWRGLRRSCAGTRWRWWCAPTAHTANWGSVSPGTRARPTCSKPTSLLLPHAHRCARRRPGVLPLVDQRESRPVVSAGHRPISDIRSARFVALKRTSQARGPTRPASWRPLRVPPAPERSCRWVSGACTSQRVCRPQTSPTRASASELKRPADSPSGVATSHAHNESLNCEATALRDVPLQTTWR